MKQRKMYALFENCTRAYNISWSVTSNISSMMAHFKKLHTGIKNVKKNNRMVNTWNT